MVFGELYRNAGEWKFRAVGQGYATGLRGIALDFGEERLVEMRLVVHLPDGTQLYARLLDVDQKV